MVWNKNVVEMLMCFIHMGGISPIRLQLLTPAARLDSSSPVCVHLCNQLQLELINICVKAVI